MKNRLITILILFIAGSSICNSKSKAYRYRLYLTDKAVSGFSIDRPNEFLSEKSLNRRQRQGLCIDEHDLPVSKAYISEISKKGVKIKATSKWNNTVLVETTDTLQIATTIGKLPFVSSYKKVWTEPDTIPPKTSFAERTQGIKDSIKPIKDSYGYAAANIDMLNARSLHQLGFRGREMNIAIIDAGFLNADTLKLLRSTRIGGTNNLISSSEDIYAASSHGMNVLALMGARVQNVMVGTAPDATYWLLKSEDSNSESLAEEDFWASAIEYADSIGVDVVNSSLGYYEFDDEATNYQYRDLDGRTALISRTASLAASRGMILCTSAGNAGRTRWHKISVPADAPDVLSVGAIDHNGNNSAFSSVGNTADGRIKPDVVALGDDVYVPSANGHVRRGSGTSFASPILCGAVACLWEKHPHANAYEVMESVRRSANRHDFPDNIYGYGLPDFEKADKILESIQWKH